MLFSKNLLPLYYFKNLVTKMDTSAYIIYQSALIKNVIFEAVIFEAIWDNNGVPREGYKLSHS
jgi:hypothetical protein